MAKKQNGYYFDCFVNLAERACEAARYLRGMVEDCTPASLEEQMEAMHEIEHAADLERHAVVEKLIREFLPPIESEDILALLDKIDDLTDYIEEISRELYMYRIRSVRPEASQLAGLICQCCEVLKLALMEFKDFRRSVSLKEHMVKLNELEETGDILHRDAIRQLYGDCDNPVEVLRWTQIFESMENCCDAAEQVGELMQIIIMKNS